MLLCSPTPTNGWPNQGFIKIEQGVQSSLIAALTSSRKWLGRVHENDLKKDPGSRIRIQGRIQEVDPRKESGKSSGRSSRVWERTQK